MSYSNVKYNANDIANHFIKQGVTPLKLQKLLYYAQVWFYVKHSQLLFNDDIEAWVYGPVIKDIWRQYRYLYRFDFIDKSVARDDIYLDFYTKNHLDEICKVYLNFTSSELVELTHSELPWQIAREGLSIKQSSNNIISINDSIRLTYQLDILGNIPVPTIPDDKNSLRFLIS